MTINCWFGYFGGDYSNLTSIQILFTPSEVISNFIVGDISHNGQITNLEASGNNYIATFRPYSNNKKTPKNSLY